MKEASFTMAYYKRNPKHVHSQCIFYKYRFSTKEINKTDFLAFSPSESEPGLLPNFMLSNKSTDIKCVTTNQQPIEGKILWHSSPQEMYIFKK